MEFFLTYNKIFKIVLKKELFICRFHLVDKHCEHHEIRRIRLDLATVACVSHMLPYYQPLIKLEKISSYTYAIAYANLTIN